MAQLFHKSANSLSKAGIVALAVLAVAAAGVYELLDRSPYVDEKRVVREQPVPFSHKHHVGELGIDCRFCHASVENSAFAGLPPVSTCMTCHSQLFTDASMLEPVREAARTGRPLKWVRVNDLPQFVYFDHGIHVHKGVGCTSCHGPVGEMPLTWRQTSLEMRWCLTCHKNPENFVRPREDVFLADYRAPAGQAALGRSLVVANHIQKLTDCAACHR